MSRIAVLFISAGSVVCLAYYFGRRSAKVNEDKDTDFSLKQTCNKLEDGLVVISGASKGIGLATAKHFKTLGWEVLNISRSNCPLQGVSNFNADLSVPGWESEFSVFLEKLKISKRRICLIHNAAVMLRDSSLAVNLAEMRRSFEVNLIAPCALNSMLSSLMGPGSSILYVS